jgi:hypothetical protein
LSLSILGGISVGWLNGGKYGIEYDGDPDGFIGMGLKGSCEDGGGS